MPSPEDDPAAPVVELELPLCAPPPGSAPFDLEAAVCSHGLFMMAPNRWDPASRALVRPLRLAARPSDSLLVSILGAADSLTPLDQSSILEQVRRMLRLGEEDGRAVAEFQSMHAVAREAGFGRIFRSPTLFEDMVKCILLCNCQWTRTLSMSAALCDLQLELRCSSSTERFQSRTPPIRECKRKRSNKRNVRVKLETKFAKDELVCLEDPNLATGTSNDTTNQQTYENSFSLLSATSETGSTAEVSLDHSELKLGNGLCLEDCGGDFPIPEELANLDEDFLAKRCNLGYRAKRIVMLARSIVEGKVCLENFEGICKMSEPALEGLSATPSSYERLNEELSTISGFGPFTRANVLMCMGFFHMIPADTETIRHLKQFHKRKSTISSIQKELNDIYGKYAPFQFLAYWFELWGFYDKQFGKISDMEPINYGLFTASYLKKAIANS
uniref:HhH-GPD domain-containing protein n=1 Tax=Oryza brachyantha TaxID=4533 RepID=J3MNP5_ORYBR